jgi:hypothetical protein
VLEDIGVVGDLIGLDPLDEPLQCGAVPGVDSGRQCLHHPELGEAEVALVRHRPPELGGGARDRVLEYRQRIGGRVVQAGVVQVPEHDAQALRSVRRVVGRDGDLSRHPLEEELPDRRRGPEAQTPVGTVVPEVESRRQDEGVHGDPQT